MAVVTGEGGIKTAASAGQAAVLLAMSLEEQELRERVTRAGLPHPKGTMAEMVRTYRVLPPLAEVAAEPEARVVMLQRMG